MTTKKQAAKAAGEPATADAVPAGVLRIAIDKDPFIAGGVEVSRIDVHPIGFTAWTRAIERASDLQKPGMSGAEFTFNQRRELIKAQCKATDGAGREVALSDLDIMTMPRRYGVRLLESVGLMTAPVGNIVSAGNGIDAPAIFALGTPIRASKSDSLVEIAELEFSAGSMGEIGLVVCAGSDPERAVAFLSACARIAGTSTKLPAAAIDQISLTDGMKIMREVMPAFLE